MEYITSPGLIYFITRRLYFFDYLHILRNFYSEQLIALNSEEKKSKNKMKKSHDCGASTKLLLLLILSRMERDGLGKVDEGPHFYSFKDKKRGLKYVHSIKGRKNKVLENERGIWEGYHILRQESGRHRCEFQEAFHLCFLNLLRPVTSSEAVPAHPAQKPSSPTQEELSSLEHRL